METRFIISAVRPEQFPPDSNAWPEVAFLGRSNVGKSSLLNALAGNSKLAFTSSRPGCTQAINFYQIDEDMRFVDLPGYGFAQVPKDMKREWKRLIETYLAERKNLELSILLVDSRRGWMEMDLELKRWLESQSRDYVVVATKTDKLKTQREQHRGMLALREHLPDREPLPFSAVTRRGVREIWQAISKIRNKAPQ